MVILVMNIVVMNAKAKMKQSKRNKDPSVLDVKKIRFVVRTPNFVLNV
jgi:hypothetical protein